MAVCFQRTGVDKCGEMSPFQRGKTRTKRGGRPQPCLEPPGGNGSATCLRMSRCQCCLLGLLSRSHLAVCLSVQASRAPTSIQFSETLLAPCSSGHPSLPVWVLASFLGHPSLPRLFWDLWCPDFAHLASWPHPGSVSIAQGWCPSQVLAHHFLDLCCCWLQAAWRNQIAPCTFGLEISAKYPSSSLANFAFHSAEHNPAKPLPPPVSVAASLFAQTPPEWPLLPVFPPAVSSDSPGFYTHNSSKPPASPVTRLHSPFHTSRCLFQPTSRDQNLCCFPRAALTKCYKLGSL